jgi:hypothetical protein
MSVCLGRFARPSHAGPDHVGAGEWGGGFVSGRREDMRQMILHTKRNFFALRTLERLVDCLARA